MPRGVRLTISLMLGRLSPMAARVLSIAAIAGRRFLFNLIQAVAGLSAEALVEVLDELIRARLVESSQLDNEAWFVFSHELIRQTVLSNLSLPRRQELRLRMAKAIEGLAPGSADDYYEPQVAHHLYQAGPLADPARAVPHLIAAGERSLDACAFEEALRCFQRALSLGPSSENVTAEIEYKQGLAERSLSKWKDALRSWERALARFEANGELESAGKICARLNSELAWSGRCADSIKMGARGLALLGELVSADRCRMLAANGATLSLAGHHDAGIAMIEQAGAMAQELHNARLKGIALYAETLHHYGYMRPRSILEISANALEQFNSHDDAWLISDLQCFRIGAHIALANFDELSKAYAELKPLAVRLGNLVALISANRDQMSQQLLVSGDITRWREFMLSDLAECERIHNFALSAGSLSCLGIVEMWRGNWDEALSQFKEGAAREPAGPVGGNWILVAMVKAYAGDSEEAIAMIQRRQAELARPNRENSLAAWMTMLGAVEVYFVAGQGEPAGQLYPMVLQALETGVMFRAYDFRLLETVAGIAATAAGNWDAAEVHFAKAMRISAEMPHRIEQPEVRRFYAQMLIERDGPGDREKAHQILVEALDMYGQLGMPKHREMAGALSRRAAAIVAGRAVVPTASIFCRDGHYWTLTYAGKVVRLKDAKGLRDIACLLAIPGRSLHVADLVAASEGELRDPRSERYAAMSHEALREMGLEVSSSANEPLIDAQARKTYRARLAELREELEEAERMGDPVRTDWVRRELDAIAGQLSAAYGLGRRRREPNDPAERARIAVAMRIRGALERIEKEHLQLGRHLSRAIQTGTFCTYSPEIPTIWEL